MRKITLTLFALGIALLSFSQGNRIPSSGNVGIGTLTPGRPLSVIGTIRSSNEANENKYLSIRHGGINGYINVGKKADVTEPSGNLDFRFDSNTKMTLASDGKLGIGTSSPDEELSVIGKIRSANDVNETKTMEMWHSGNNGYINTTFGSLKFRHSNITRMTLTNTGLGIGTSTPVQELSVIGGIRSAHDVGENLFVELNHGGVNGYINTAKDGGNLHFRFDGKTKMNLTSAGDLAIGGDFIPKNSLHVRGSIRQTSHDFILDNSQFAHFVRNAHYESGQWKYLHNSSAEKLYIGRSGLKFATANTGSAGGTLNWENRFTINGNGNVSIGTSESAHKLTVRGTVKAMEIICENVGADYVFADDYKLRSLEEVEDFVTENDHLPGIAPASETEKGVGLAEFTEKLLEKIEELTLYTIEQEKRIKALEASRK